MDEAREKLESLSKAHNLALITIIPILIMFLNNGTRTKITALTDIPIERSYLGLIFILLLPVFSIHISFLWEGLLRACSSNPNLSTSVESHSWWLNPFKFMSDGPNFYSQTSSFILFIIMFFFRLDSCPPKLKL